MMVESHDHDETLRKLDDDY